MGSSAPCWSQHRVEESFGHGERGIAPRRDTRASPRCSESFCAGLPAPPRTAPAPETLPWGQEALWVRGVTRTEPDGGQVPGGP